jgi:hypothetical protein
VTGGSPEERAEQRARRRRLAEVFGDDLPEQTRDDADDPGDPADRRTGDDWLRSQVPPHHGS